MSGKFEVAGFVGAGQGIELCVACVEEIDADTGAGKAVMSTDAGSRRCDRCGDPFVSEGSAE